MDLSPLLNVEVRSEHDVVHARQRARQIAEQLGFDTIDQAGFATAVSEMVRNAQRYAGGGRVVFWIHAREPQAVEVVVSDHGRGIADLGAVLDGRYRSKTGLGMGIIGARRLVDEFSIISTPDDGTRVRMVKYLPERARATFRQSLQTLAATLAKRLASDPLAEIQHQNQELIRSLDEVRRRQDELTQLNHELEDTNRGVVALYAELDTQAQALGRASQLKSRFLSNMTHEFRTPLNSIHALANLLLECIDGPLTAGQEKQVGFIRRACEQLGELVDDLLDLAKVEAGKVTLKVEEFTVADLFGALKGMLRPLITPTREVALEFDQPVDLPPLYSDQGKIAQILRNLIANALKFTDRGEVRVAARRSGDDAIAFTVRDSGVGIAPEHLALIFDEFTQVDSAQRPGIKGTGLGLPLSRRLAELLGGQVTVQSAVGRGSTFTLRLPIEHRGSGQVPIVTEQRGAPPPSARTSDRLRAARPPQPKVLIIDDDEVARYLLRGMLPPGLAIVEAGSGLEGLKAMRDERPQLAFLDLNMPDVSGSEVLARAKADPATAGVAVAIYTAQVIDDAARLRLSAAIDILSKRTGTRDQASSEIRRTLEKAGIRPAEVG